MTEAKKKTLGLAIGSLVCGCFFIIPFLGQLLGLISIVLGIIALIIIAKNKDTLKGTGLAIAGIILGAIAWIIMPIIGIIAAIAIPNFLKARLVANESSAISTLKTISSAAQTFYVDNNQYPQWSSELTSAEPAYLDQDYTIQPYTGYNFAIIDTNDKTTFLATAIPAQLGISGIRSFCVTDDGIVRFNPRGEDIFSYSGCKALESADTAQYYP
jgi:type II secretory pathway pseudopilin PulG